MGKKYKGFKGSGMSNYAPASKSKVLSPQILAKLMMADMEMRSEHAVVTMEQKEENFNGKED